MGGSSCLLAEAAAGAALIIGHPFGHQAQQRARITASCMPGSSSSSSSKASRRWRVLVQSWRWQDEEELESPASSFDDGVDMFNKGDYYKCHDVFEGLWNDADEPQRTLLHGLVQLSVALFHLSNRNYRGAMVELGEGTAKLARLKLKGNLGDFEEGMKAVLDFLYKTQVQNASDDESHCTYQMLADFGAGQDLYHLEAGNMLTFFPETGSSRVIRLPRLLASKHDLDMLEF